MSGLQFLAYAAAIVGIGLIVFGAAQLRTADGSVSALPDSALAGPGRDELSPAEVVRQGAWSVILAGSALLLSAWVIGRSYFRQLVEF